MNREVRIDIIRGLAMLTIALNHMGSLLDELGYNGINIPTLTYFGYSSSAEIFFLVSGYMVGLVYLGRPNLRPKVFARAKKIYSYNLLVYIFIIALAYILPTKVEVATDLDYSLANLSWATSKFLLFLQHPYLLGVLQLYVVLMLLTPAAAALIRYSKIAFFCVSGSLFLTTKLFPEFNIPGGAPDGDGLWNFNPFAWQFLFFLGMFFGSKNIHKPFFNWIDSSSKNVSYIFFTFCIFAIIFRLGFGTHAASAFFSKTNLGFLNFFHTFLALATMAAIATMLMRYINPAAEILSIVGKNTLECYAISIPLTYIMGAVWLRLPNNFSSYALVNALVLIGIISTSFIKIRISERSRKHLEAK